MNRAGLIFFNLIYYPVFIIMSLIVIALLTVCVAGVSVFLGRRGTMKLYRRAIAWYAHVIVLCFFPFIRVKYEDRSKDDGSRAYIFVANHRSFVDSYLTCFLPYEGVLIVNKWPFHIPVLGIYARFAGYMNINKMAPETFFGKAMKFIREDVSMVFFPEGTRATGRKMGRFHGAAFRLALLSQLPVVPLCISGTEKILPKGSLLIRPGTLTIRRMAAIQWEDYKTFTAFAFKNRVHNIVRKELESMEGAS